METHLPCYSDLMFFCMLSHAPMGFSNNSNVSPCSIKMPTVLETERKFEDMAQFCLSLRRDHLSGIC